VFLNCEEDNECGWHLRVQFQTGKIAPISDGSSHAARLLAELLENGPKTASKSLIPKCFCGTRQSKNHASLSACASGTPGESGWPARTNGGSTANLSGGAHQDSFFLGPTALPWAAQPCTMLCGDSTWQQSAAASWGVPDVADRRECS
jgi:hypothetical protein